MRAKTKGFLSDLDELTPQRVIALLVILAIIGVGIYFAVKGIKKLIAKEKTANNILNLEMQGIVATYKPSEYTAMAETLYSAMYGAGTNESEIKSVFYKMKNQLDVEKLDQAFGVQKSAGWFSPDMNLRQYLRSDLSASDIKIISDYLVSKNIDYKI